MIDLKRLEKSLTPEQIIQLVQGLGANRYEEKDDCILFPTLCHNENVEESKMKLYYYKKNKKFHCYTNCGCNFNIYDLFKRRYELLNINYDFYKDIVLKIADGQVFETVSDNFGQLYKGIGDRYKPYQATVSLPELPSHLLNAFTFFPTIEWLSDGIGINEMRHYNILFSINQNKIIIPHYDVDNRLIGIRGRGLNEEDIKIGKYMPVQIEGKIYSHPLGYNLYGLNFVKNNIRRKKMAIVLEGEKSTLQFEHMFGVENNIAVAVCGSSLSQYQVELLRQQGAEKIVVAFDNPANPTNTKELENQFQKMKKMCEKYAHIITIGFIIDRQGLLDEKDSPTDKGKEIFQTLFKHTYWIN